MTPARTSSATSTATGCAMKTSSSPICSARPTSSSSTCSPSRRARRAGASTPRAAPEFLINIFAQSAGKKGGDFYPPRDVIRLMVRILKPTPGLSVYDPTCGSGGMLIISREFIEQSGGDPTNLRLCGQVNDASAWSICRLNMLLHGVPGADIQLADTLLHPLHREAGELERFDRVNATPPFSQNYTKTTMEFPDRFRWGW